MARKCDACLVTCEDYRLHRRPDGRDLIGKFVMGLGCDCDVITRAGSVQDLVRPQGDADRSLLRDLRISIEKHGVRTIYLINHENCGAYADLTFESREDELAYHLKDLEHAARTVQKAFPQVRIVPLLAELTDSEGDQDQFNQPARTPEKLA